MGADPELLGEAESAVNVGPQDCGLCVALPLAREDVLRHLAEPARFGYVPGIVQDRAVTPALVNDLWKLYSSQVVMSVQALCSKLRRMKVLVRLEAGLSEVAEVARLRRVVLLWTHWQAPSFRNEDITNPDQFVHLAESGTSWVCREVREGLRSRRFWGLWKESFRAAVEGARTGGRLGPFIASALNRTIDWARSAREATFRREYDRKIM